MSTYVSICPVTYEPLISIVSLYFHCIHPQVTTILLETVQAASEIKHWHVYSTCFFWNMAYFTILRNLTFCGTWKKLLPFVAQESLSIIYQMAFFPAHQLRILRPPPHHVLRSLAFNMDMCMACLFDILIKFPWDKQIAISGAAPSYASYIFNIFGTSTLFP